MPATSLASDPASGDVIAPLPQVEADLSVLEETLPAGPCARSTGGTCCQACARTGHRHAFGGEGEGETTHPEPHA